MKGQKVCPSCGVGNGPRSYTCKSCHHQFAFKPKSKEAKNTKIIRDINWRELVKGDRIKVAAGPFYIHKGEFINMGYKGRFVVESLDKNGILAWGLDKHNGFCHIWMGGDIQNSETKIWKTKHKLMKLKPKENV